MQPIGEWVVAGALDAIKKEWGEYPNQPDRDRANPGNKPHPYNTYVRGIGQFPRSSFAQVNSKWERKAKGAYKSGPAGGKVRRTSQQMSKRWRMSVHQVDDGVEGELENTASYAGYVIGHSDGSDPAQVPFHAQTGWVGEEDALQRAQPTIDKLVNAATDEILSRLGGA